MTKEQFKLAIQFVELDQRISHLIQEQDDLLKKEQQLHQELAQIEQEEKAAQQTVQALKKKVDLVELEAKALADTQHQTREKMLVASTEKALNSLHLELQDISKKRATVDEQGLELLNELEKAGRQAGHLESTNPEKVAAKQQEIEEGTQRLATIGKLIEAYSREKEHCSQQVPEEFLTQFVGMKERVANPVVPIINDGCSGCFYGINRPDLIKAQQGSLITCKGCYRMLYATSALSDENHDQ